MNDPYTLGFLELDFIACTSPERPVLMIYCIYFHLVAMADKYEEYDFEEVQGRAGRKGRSKTEVCSLHFFNFVQCS